MRIKVKVRSLSPGYTARGKQMLWSACSQLKLVFIENYRDQGINLEVVVQKLMETQTKPEASKNPRISSVVLICFSGHSLSVSGTLTGSRDWE